jgi:eukaryotic-like serine/threonine-protein kinase
VTPERYRKAGHLYHAALEVEPDARAAFLDGACGGDEELRREVESLLTAHDKVGNYFAAPALEVAAGLLADRKNPSMMGQSLSHYRVHSLIGAGGMGEVYLAEDLQLGRKVALKFLPKEFTEDRERVRRFAQEARATSSLNHPNIVTIFEVGEVDGRHFIATEYVDGQTLRERFTGAPLELHEALDVSAQIASALGAAHEAGIVHRELYVAGGSVDQ